MTEVRPREVLLGGADVEVRRRYAELVDVLLREGRGEAARSVADLAVSHGVWSHPLQRPVDFHPGLEPRPVYDATQMWFVAHLESWFPAIRAEVDARLRDAGSPDGSAGFAPVDEPLLSAGRWDQVVLYEAGRRQEEACAMFPVTAAAVAEIPEATTMGPGVVTLSLMQPGSRVRPHCGRTNAQLRVHLGVRVPGGASMRVGDEWVTWEEGRCLVFDDSFEHEVRHEGDKPRLILLIDVLHPDLTEDGRRRVLGRRATVEQQVAAFMLENDLDAVESGANGVVMRPSAGSSALIRRYMVETGATAVRRDASGIRFDRQPTPPDATPADGPDDRLSEAVRAAWMEVLERTDIGWDDDFFELGGNSLHAVRIVARLSEDLHVELSVRAVLEHASPRAMAAYVPTVLGDAQARPC
ncbi:aspartyl/asparaginyl beta-hydroxylase domain-containing protein [Goekera deserti]|uniref:Aspartyl/asparaginyl beta-hydroxylase domain-containing protein n=1 Tax=Goekera deserti TaxID=2497753 RepID=A0A7K3WDA0_9ACTN|nr:aspartyl/asparaginyl beta-hydroxylase domain-containing protein [Goekera deserti]NDI46768.1 aspartyl/asparaginyl beta-hydroxylase domain-containing protein [Goekera deserti]NEL54337.1 aspartyl/asparaginyl beta-hydroxylase domain-containing protein [Goekera deserti]